MSLAGGIGPMGWAMLAASAHQPPATVERLEKDNRLILAGTVHEPQGVDLDPKQIFKGWQVPSSELIVQAGTVPLAVMREITRNPEVLRILDPRQFEVTIAELLSSHGFQNVKVTPRSGDGGKDIIACQMVLGMPVVFYFECKQYKQEYPVPLPDLRALLGVVLPGQISKGVLVTTSRFTQGGRDLIAQNAVLEGRDYDDLVGWVGNLKSQ